MAMTAEEKTEENTSSGDKPDVQLDHVTETPDPDEQELTEKPEVPASDEPAPDELVIDDVVVGDGAEAVEGSTADVKYVGAFYESGEEFDSSWDRGADETISVPLGAGRVIPGFGFRTSHLLVVRRDEYLTPPSYARRRCGRSPSQRSRQLCFSAIGRAGSCSEGKRRRASSRGGLAGSSCCGFAVRSRPAPRVDAHRHG